MRGRFDPRRRRAEEPVAKKADDVAGLGSDAAELTAIVAALHFDLAEWLGSDAPLKVFDRISGALDEQFTSVVTTGQAVDRETFLSSLWSARNVLAGVRIEVSEGSEVARSGQLIVVRFIAENRVGDARTGRRTVTAALVTDGRTHLWRTVHETPLPEVPQSATSPEPVGSPAAEIDAPQEAVVSGSASAEATDAATGAGENGDGSETAAAPESPEELRSTDEDVAGAEADVAGAEEDAAGGEEDVAATEPEVVDAVPEPAAGVRGGDLDDLAGELVALGFVSAEQVFGAGGEDGGRAGADAAE
ncbi:ribonuclease E domain-containing protein [Nocardia seriolae]|uniref:hypothetical protein n=1 Tax=Nocardia seriolae TaxID=37332 RepID=UPI00068AD52F|nr:hypothetical protein [Nocardia seriolae]MTJ61818.1 hypothetical protein [Nocardia seriolae]MTJ73089.1 hypothetical protein [Nocardia seriolae]MTJ90146.1 hypothetical protein [Nocardia seriolae]MTK34109.1 hypothetical protein [Nocardia seriolae]MTK39763.1 hypothetical protein [Nocardia seriolae]